MTTTLECKCGWYGDVTFAVDHNEWWECPTCGTKAEWTGPYGARPVEMPVLAEGVVSVYDGDFGISGDKG